MCVWGGHRVSRFGHTLLELVVAMVCSAMLLAGLASVMFIGGQVAYTPSAATRRIDAASIIQQISDELQYATLIVEHSPQVLDFVVADRDGDGTAEKFRYEWSGVAGEPLFKSMNGAALVPVIDSVHEFTATVVSKSESTSFATMTDSVEAVLLSNDAVQNGPPRDITATSYAAQQIDPALFSASIPADAIGFNVTKVEFYGQRGDFTADTLLVQLRSAGDPGNGPTSHVLGQANVAENALSAGVAWNTVVFNAPIRGLPLPRAYDLVWAAMDSGPAAKLTIDDGAASGILTSDDAGASWQPMSDQQVFYRLYGSYTTPGPTLAITRNFGTNVHLVLQSSQRSHARIDASVPLRNVPELLSAYWRADFETNPTTTDTNGDTLADWAMADGASFDPDTLSSGAWHASGALETRPANDFVEPTTVHVRCRNTSVGGNGAVVSINADRQAGLHGSLMVRVQRQPDGTQTLTLLGRTSDVATTTLFTSPRLSGDFVEYRLTILPASDVVNVEIKGEDQGTFAYPSYAPSAADRFLTLFADTSMAEFEFVELRVAADE